jgi:hypothetical protein
MRELLAPTAAAAVLSRRLPIKMKSTVLYSCWRIPLPSRGSIYNISGPVTGPFVMSILLFLPDFQERYFITQLRS